MLYAQSMKEKMNKKEKALDFFMDFWFWRYLCSYHSSFHLLFQKTVWKCSSYHLKASTRSMLLFSCIRAHIEHRSYEKCEQIMCGVEGSFWTMSIPLFLYLEIQIWDCHGDLMWMCATHCRCRLIWVCIRSDNNRQSYMQ